MNKNIKYFRIIDILHTGHHGPAGVPKEGQRYDERRGRRISLDMSSLKCGESLCLPPVAIWTTPFEKISIDKDGIYHLTTINSEYILEEV